jgi:hypothetical protein
MVILNWQDKSLLFWVLVTRRFFHRNRELKCVLGGYLPSFFSILPSTWSEPFLLSCLFLPLCTFWRNFGVQSFDFVCFFFPSRLVYLLPLSGSLDCKGGEMEWFSGNVVGWVCCEWFQRNTCPPTHASWTSPAIFIQLYIQSARRRLKKRRNEREQSIFVKSSHAEAF